MNIFFAIIAGITLFGAVAEKNKARAGHCTAICIAAILSAAAVVILN